MKLLEVKIQLTSKDESEGLPESSVVWEDSIAVIDLDEVTCMYDTKGDGIKIYGRDFTLNAMNYNLRELTEMKLGHTPIPKLSITSISLNGDGSCDAESTGEAMGIEPDKCVLCGSYLITGDHGLECQLCGKLWAGKQ